MTAQVLDPQQTSNALLTAQRAVTVRVASNAICWGIDLALKRIAKAAENGGVEATHRWAHNPTARRWDPLEFVKRRDEQMFATYPGLEKVKVVERLGDSTSGRVAVGHHGSIESHEAAGESKVLDYTCPFIARSDQQAEKLADAGYDLVLFGKAGNHHCEFAKAIVEKKGRVGLIGENVADLLEALRQPGRNWACQGQVTANVGNWAAFKADLAASGVSVRIMDTVCTDSHDRQGEGQRFAAECDVVIVVNDHGGSTLSLYEQCRQINPRTYRYDPLAGDAFDSEWFRDAHSIAVTGGIHVPIWVLQEVGADIERRCNCG